MKKLGLSLFFIFSFNLCFADCDPTRFRWGCDLIVKARPSKAFPALVYCGNYFGYVSKHHYDVLSRYERDNINMVLKINGEYVDSPCVPAGRY